jgi:hypothetical protein
MTDLPGIVRRATTIHTAIAADLAGFGGILRCTGECGRTEELDAAKIERYLRHGWPKCCGYTMRWVTQRELSEEKARWRVSHSSAQPLR